jgi:hypothetical protein
LVVDCNAAKWSRTPSSGLLFLPCSAAPFDALRFPYFAENRANHPRPKHTVVLTRLQSPFVIVPGKERRRRSSTRARRILPHVVVNLFSSGNHQNIIAGDHRGTAPPSSHLRRPSWNPRWARSPPPLDLDPPVYIKPLNLNRYKIWAFRSPLNPTAPRPDPPEGVRANQNRARGSSLLKTNSN